MKTEKVVKRFLYKDLGVPILILDAPFRMIFGEWILDIDLNKLQKSLIYALVHKPTAMTSNEIRFVRKYFEMTTTEFGSLLGVSHAAVLKWENGKSQVPPTTEVCVRLFAYDQLKAKNGEFRKLYSDTLAGLMRSRRVRSKSATKTFKLNAKNMSMVA